MPTASFYKIGFENSKIFYEHCYGIKGQLKEWPLSVHEIALHFEDWLSNILSSLSLSEHNVRNTIANWIRRGLSSLRSHFNKQIFRYFTVINYTMESAHISTNRFLDILQ